ncbi:MAG: Methyltransferase type 11 [Candidatus Kaiserbacteria bacterium]|nr:Methyltransferase type 11 [Candidatus Kaiserbacteria bacterium]
MDVTKNKIFMMARKHAFGEMKRSWLDQLIFDKRFSQIIPHIPNETQVIADYGCGYRAEGLQYLIARKYTRRGVGLDLSITNEQLPNIRLIESDFESGVSSLADSSADCVISLAVLEHLYNARGYMSDIYRVLKPGGVLLLTTPSPYSKPVLEFMAHVLKIIDTAEIDDHKHYYNLAELRDMSKSVGFSECRAQHFELFMNDFLIAKK